MMLRVPRVVCHFCFTRAQIQDCLHLSLSTLRLTPGSKRTTIIMPRDAKAYVASKKSETSDLELAQEWAEIEELYSKRFFCCVVSVFTMLEVLSIWGERDPTLFLVR